MNNKTNKTKQSYYDIIFHFDESESQLNIAISNIKNYFLALKDEEFSAVLVVNGPGIQLMGKDGQFASSLQELHDKGLSVRVCQNALKHFHLQPDWLSPVCQIVPAGVVEIVKLQREGFVYLKP
jgi:uncharacterized protein